MEDQMGRRKRKSIAQRRKVRQKTGLSHLKIGALVFMLTVLIVAFYAFSSRETPNARKPYASSSQADMPFDGLVHIVAMEFLCACGGCGELPLIDCYCDMPRGALEEKQFILEKLREGLTPDQVIQAVEEVYGHRKLG
jgi:hypothetical protein